MVEQGLRLRPDGRNESAEAGCSPLHWRLRAPRPYVTAAFYRWPFSSSGRGVARSVIANQTAAAA